MIKFVDFKLGRILWRWHIEFSKKNFFQNILIFNIIFFNLSKIYIHNINFYKIDNNAHTNGSRSTTVSESTSTSDHHQHISPPLSRNHHPLSQSTVDSLHSCKNKSLKLIFFDYFLFYFSVPQDTATVDSIDTTVYVNEQNFELARLAPETVYTTWFRMLGSLGNINQIRSAEQHNRIMKTLLEIWTMLCDVSENNMFFFF